MSEKLAQHFDDLPYLLGGHLLLSISAVLVGVIVSVPLGAYATRNPRLKISRNSGE